MVNSHSMEVNSPTASNRNTINSNMADNTNRRHRLLRDLFLNSLQAGIRNGIKLPNGTTTLRQLQAVHNGSHQLYHSPIPRLRHQVLRLLSTDCPVMIRIVDMLEVRINISTISKEAMREHRATILMVRQDLTIQPWVGTLALVLVHIPSLLLK